MGRQTMTPNDQAQGAGGGFIAGGSPGATGSTALGTTKLRGASIASVPLERRVMRRNERTTMEQMTGANLLAMRSLAVQAKDSAGTTLGNMEALAQHYVALQVENVKLREKVDSLADGMRDVFPAAHRLALELECLLLSCTDTVATAKWWDSAHEALEQWREFCREDAEEVGAGDTALCWRCGREHDEAGYPKCACTGP